MAAAGSSESDGLVTIVNKIEDKFHTAETDLANLERRMEVEYATVFDDESSMVDNLRNPVQVVRRINEVKGEFAKIKQEVVEIQKQQKEALDTVKVEFEKLLSAVSLLENNVLNPQAGDGAVVEQEQKLLSLIDHMAKTTLPPGSKSDPPSDPADACS